MKQGFVTGLLALGLMALPIGCGVQDNTLEAQLEDALMAMDSGNFASAKSILEGLCPVGTVTCDQRVTVLLAEAHMGVAGVDLLSVIDNINTQVGAPGSNNTAVFNAIDLLFGVDGVQPTEVANLAAARDTLLNISNPTASNQLQIAMASATHMVAALVQAVDPNNTGTLDFVSLTPTVQNQLAAAVSTDLQSMLDSVAAVDAALGVSNSNLTADLEGLINDIKNNLAGTPVASNVIISNTELAAFIAQVNAP